MEPNLHRWLAVCWWWLSSRTVRSAAGAVLGVHQQTGDRDAFAVDSVMCVIGDSVHRSSTGWNVLWMLHCSSENQGQKEIKDTKQRQMPLVADRLLFSVSMSVLYQ